MTISKLFKELRNNGICSYFNWVSKVIRDFAFVFSFFSPLLVKETHAILLTNQVQNQSQSHPSHSRFFSPLFFRFLFIYIQSKYALIFRLGRVTFFRLFKPLQLTVLIISKVVDAFFTKWRNISLQPHSLLPF